MSSAGEGDGSMRRPYSPETSYQKNEVVVGMNSFAKVVAKPGQPKSVVALELVDSIVYGMILDQTDGSRVGYLQQYGPHYQHLSLKSLATNIEDLKPTTVGMIRIRIFIPVFDADGITQDGTLHPPTDTANLLQMEAIETLGPDIVTQISGYDTKIYGESGSVLIDVNTPAQSYFFLNGEPII